MVAVFSKINFDFPILFLFKFDIFRLSVPIFQALTIFFPELSLNF